MCRSVYPQHVCIYVNTPLYEESGTSSPLLWYSCTFQDVYVCWHTAVVPSWDNAGAIGCGLIVSASKCVHSMREVNPHYLFNLTRRQFFWTSRRQRRSLQRVLPTYAPLFPPAVTVQRLTCRGIGRFQDFFSCVCVFFLFFPVLPLLLLQHHVGTGWYQLVPGEDRGRTGSVRVHRLSGVHVRRRCASAPAPATRPLINGPGPDNWS